MHVQEIDVIRLQVLETLFDRLREIRRAQVLVRDLRAQEDVFARHARDAHALADAFLRAVLPRGVDVPIPELERARDDIGAIAELRGAETDRGDLRAAG